MIVLKELYAVATELGWTKEECTLKYNKEICSKTATSKEFSQLIGTIFIQSVTMASYK
jgi:hypothetical protein